jgi:hypothetical protein
MPVFLWNPVLVTFQIRFHAAQGKLSSFNPSNSDAVVEAIDQVKFLYKLTVS